MDKLCLMYLVLQLKLKTNHEKNRVYTCSCYNEFICDRS